MKVVALVSGGKDSLNAIGKCIEYGHEVVCLANLAPEQESVEELDSFCFQTVGHTHVDAIARSMRLPLVKGTIKKDTSKVTTLEYSTKPTDKEDEVERLYDLLCKVKSAHPEVTAVCSGAILSNYQRLRVESVCSRLGLVSLSYLWQRNQDDYVAEIVDREYDVKLIKVASMGLKKSHLGKSLAELKDYLASLDYCHSAGEGGEYESIVTDCSMYHDRLDMTDTKVIVETDDMFAPVARLEFSLDAVPKSPRDDRLLPAKVQTTPQYAFTGTTPKTLPAPSSHKWVSSNAQWVIHSGLTAPSKGSLEDTTAELLSTVDSVGTDGCFVHVYGKSIKGFAAVNKGYNTHFDTNPPSRAFVEVGAQENDVTLDVMLYKGMREVLHVQSISEWAPACIGPYAQATTIGGTVLHAGMLGLDPPTMTLATPAEEDRTEAARMQAERALLSYEAVMPIVSSSMECVGLGVSYVLDPADVAQVRDVWAARYTDVPCLVVAVTALPKFAAFELQLMSTLTTADPATSTTTEHTVSVFFGNMCYTVSQLAHLDEALASYEGTDYEPGHVKVFVTEDDYQSDKLAAAGGLPTTILPTTGCVCLHKVFASSHGSMALIWGARK